MKILTVVALLIFFYSCNNNKTADKTPETTKPSTSTQCYEYLSDADTVSLKLIHVGEAVTGTLLYAYREKDRNQGTIQGNIKGDWLVADYTFMSEGISSVRQVAFKKEGDHFIEGFGDVETKDNKVVFKNPDSLTLNNKMELHEVKCQ